MCGLKEGPSEKRQESESIYLGDGQLLYRPRGGKEPYLQRNDSQLVPTFVAAPLKSSLPTLRLFNS